MGRPVQQVSVVEECVPNIGTRGRIRRVIGGTIWTGITGGVFAIFASRHAPREMYLVLAPFAAIAALYFFQVKEKTCVVLAPRGLREADDGRTKTRLSGERLVAVQRQARKVWLQTFAATIVTTATAFLWACSR